MLFQVSKNNITVLRPEVVNEGEYNVSPCEFNFDNIYSGLVKKAVFTNYLVEGSYEVPILNNKCVIPSEVLEKNGEITLGVYAYEVQNDELKLRYSPAPVHIEVNKGSFIEGATSPEVITPSQFEQYMQAMENGLAEVENVNIDAVKQGNTTTVTITNRDGITKSVQIKDGKDDNGGSSNFNELSNRPKYNGSEMSGSTNIPKVPTKTSDLTNNSGYQTESEVQSAISTAIAGKQNQLTAGTNIVIDGNVISATDTTYTAGSGISIQNGVISLSLTSAESESF